MGFRGRPLTDTDLRAFEATWEQAGQRVASLLDGVAAVAVLGDDPIATRAVAQGLARTQALHRRVFFGDLLGDDQTSERDGVPGISDMIRYGISLGKVAQSSVDSPNLYHLTGGAESPLAADVLGSRRWGSLNDQLHQAGGLLVLAAPSQVPDLAAFLAQLDGVVLVGEVAAPPAIRVLGEVRTAATMRTPLPARAAAPARTPTSRGVGGWVAAIAVVIATVFAVPQTRAPLFRYLGISAASPAPVAEPSLISLPPVEPRITSDAAWSAELRYLNSRLDAQALVQAFVDSFPAATFAAVQTAADSTPWYRVLLGAFSDSLSAESFLVALRTRGTVPLAGGSVSHTPYAFLVDSASSPDMARLRITLYQGRGLPAYALRDTASVWHVYVGAFGTSAEAGPLQRELDSLNIQSALVVRAGSTS